MIMPGGGVLPEKYWVHMCSLFQALGQWGRLKARVRDERDLVSAPSASPTYFFNRSHSSRARIFDLPY